MIYAVITGLIGILGAFQILWAHFKISFREVLKIGYTYLYLAVRFALHFGLYFLPINLIMNNSITNVAFNNKVIYAIILGIGYEIILRSEFSINGKGKSKSQEFNQNAIRRGIFDFIAFFQEFFFALIKEIIIRENMRNAKKMVSNLSFNDLVTKLNMHTKLIPEHFKERLNALLTENQNQIENDNTSSEEAVYQIVLELLDCIPSATLSEILS